MASPEGEMDTPLMSGLVTHIVDPSDFWLRIGTDAALASYEEFEQALNPALRRLPVGKTDRVVEHSTVLVRCLRQWRRATVSRIDRKKNMFDVLYIDYGNSEIVPATSICQDVPADIEQYPSSCCRCALAGIQPIAKSWTSRGVKTFEKLASKRMLKVAVVSYDHFTMSYRVALYRGDEGERSLTHQLLDAETGLPTDEKVEEYAKDVVPVPFDSLYGCSMDYDELGEPPVELATEICPFGEPSTEPTGQPSQTISTPSTSPVDSQGDSTTDDQLGGWDYQPNRASALQANGAESERHSDGAEEGGMSPTEASSVVVPGFNLSIFQQRQMLSAEELQKEKEEAMRAERKAKLQKDIIDCHRDLDSIAMTSGEGQKWGTSDLLIGRQISEEYELHMPASIAKTITDYNPTEEKRGSGDGSGKLDDGKEMSTALAPEEKAFKHNQEDNSQEQGAALFVTKAPAESQSVEHPLPEEENFLLLGSRSAPTSAREQSPFPLPPPPQMTVEESEYHRQKQFKQILQDALNGEESDVVFAQFYSLVPLDADHSEEEMKLLMQLLLEEAVRNREVTDLALEVVSAYSSVLKGTELLALLKYTCDRFVKLPVGKMLKHHADFASVLVKMVYLAFEWPPLLKSVVQDFALHCLERWIIFNKKGSQTGLVQHHLEEMYTECAELLLPPCSSILQAADPERFSFIFDEMREKVLETEVDYEIRSRLLTLLIKFGAPSFDPNALTDTAEPSPQKRTKNRGVQVDPPSPVAVPVTSQAQSSPNKSKDRSQGTEVWTGDCSSQMDDPVIGRGASRAYQDAAVQTEVVCELSLLQQTGASGLAGTERVDSTTVTAPGRARRRRAVMEHLLKGSNKKSGAFSSPESGLLLTTTSADVLSQPMEKNAADKPPDTKTVDAETGRDAGPDLCSFADDRFKISQGNGIDGTKLPSQSEISSSASEAERRSVSKTKSSSVSKSNGVNVPGGACDGDEGEGSQPESSASSFFSAVSSVSRSAWRSVFGDQPENDHLDVNPAGLEPETWADHDTVLGEVDPPVSHFSISSSSANTPQGRRVRGKGTETGSDRRETFARPGVCSAGQATAGRGRGERGSASSGDKHTGLADSDTGKEGVNNHMEGTAVNVEFFASWESSSEEDWFDWEEEEEVAAAVAVADRPAEESRAVPNVDSKLEEDFPPLTHQASRTTPRTVTPPTLTQLSLKSIATDILGCPLVEPSAGEATEGFAFQDRKSPGQRADGCKADEAEASTGIKLPKKKVEKVVESADSSSEVYVSGDDNDAGSVPSDWEDRASSSVANLGSKENLADGSLEGRTGSVAVNERWYGSSLSAGDGLMGGMPVSTQPHMMDDSGDGLAPKVSPSLNKFGSSANRRGGGSYVGSDHRHASCVTKNEPPAEGESNFIPLGGRPLSPVAMPQQGAMSPGDCMEYERGDLAFMAREKGKGKSKGSRKTKFRPFDERQSTKEAVRAEPREKWRPKTITCVNCGAEGHMRSDCPKPRQHLLF